jgi:hypothetical protein
MTSLRTVALTIMAALATGCPKPPPPVEPDLSRSEVAVDRPSGAMADGFDRIEIRVTVRDSTGAPLSGVAVQLAATGSGNMLLQPAAPTDADGVAVGALSSIVAESKTVSATLPQGPIPSQPVVVFMAPPPTGVTGTRAIHHVTDYGVVDRPVDLSGVIIGAYVPGDGGYAYYAGTGTDAGTFQIPGVPAGPYLLRFGASYVATASRTVDLSSASLGRPDTVPAGSGTRLHVQLTGLTPWTPNWPGTTWAGSLHLSSSNAGIRISELEYFTEDGGRPSAGDTAVDLINPYTAYPRNLLDAARGDRAYVVQYTVHDAGYHNISPAVVNWDFYKSIASAYGPFPLTVADGQLTDLAGTLSPTAPQRVPVQWQLDESTPGSFTSFRTDVNPNATLSFHHFRLNTFPSGQGSYLVSGSVGSAESLALGILPGEYHQPDRSLVIEYGDPFPGPWVRFGYVETIFTVNLSMGFSINGAISVIDRLSTFPTMPLRPQVGPIRGATVQGVSIFSDQTLATATPLILWSPPAVGVPTYYSVRISELQPGFADPAAIIQTTGTQLVVPPGILQPGRYYNVTIAAVVEPGHAIETMPFMHPFPEHSADAVGGLLTMP